MAQKDDENMTPEELKKFNRQKWVETTLGCRQISKLALNRKYGWIRPSRQPLSKIILVKGKGPLPSSVDLRSKCPPVYNQGRLASCTANAVGGLCQFIMPTRQKWTPSRLALYYYTRVKEGTVNQDVGARLYNAVDTSRKPGICPEKLWTYTDSGTKWKTEPPQYVYNTSKQNRTAPRINIASYNLDAMKSCLADGYPFVFGFQIYESFTTIGKNGIMPMPGPGERVLGGHAVMAVGYNNNTQYMLARNSYGPNWGLRGYFWMPFAFIINPIYTAEFYTIHKFEAFSNSGMCSIYTISYKFGQP